VAGLAELEDESGVVRVDHFTVGSEEAARLPESWAQDVEPGAYVSVVVWRTAEAFRDSIERAAAGVHRFGAVEVDPAAREVRKSGRPVRLTLKEFELLLALVSNPHRVFAREELMDRIWGYRAALETGTLSVHMRRLRMKLEDVPAEPRHLETVWGIGYRFVP
jgi:DNA-binding response OmpR family regulator